MQVRLNNDTLQTLGDTLWCLREWQKTVHGSTMNVCSYKLISGGWYQKYRTLVLIMLIKASLYANVSLCKQATLILHGTYIDEAVCHNFRSHIHKVFPFIFFWAQPFVCVYSLHLCSWCCSYVYIYPVCTCICDPKIAVLYFINIFAEANLVLAL